MNYKVIEDKLHLGNYRVESIGADGEVYVAIFSGPDAKTRAQNYATDGWVSIKSRLPAASNRVLVSLCGIVVTEGHYNHDKNIWRKGNEMRGELLGVTHWMPLPDPPRVKVCIL